VHEAPASVVSWMPPLEPHPASATRAPTAATTSAYGRFGVAVPGEGDITAAGGGVAAGWAGTPAAGVGRGGAEPPRANPPSPAGAGGAAPPPDRGGRRRPGPPLGSPRPPPGGPRTSGRAAASGTGWRRSSGTRAGRSSPRGTCAACARRSAAPPAPRPRPATG